MSFFNDNYWERAHEVSLASIEDNANWFPPSPSESFYKHLSKYAKQPQTRDDRDFD